MEKGGIKKMVIACLISGIVGILIGVAGSRIFDKRFDKLQENVVTEIQKLKGKV
jgi:hypothetical protein